VAPIIPVYCSRQDHDRSWFTGSAFNNGAVFRLGFRAWPRQDDDCPAAPATFIFRVSFVPAEFRRERSILPAFAPGGNIVVVYQDPANKSQTGTGHSVRDQLNEVLAECDLGAIDGSNDRIGGWLLMYEMLARGQWLIADTSDSICICR
jgi:hypothetical protein